MSAKNWTAEYALNKMHGYSIAPRKPLLPLKESEGQDFMSALHELLELEARYAKQPVVPGL
jgi:4-hydroxy-2-oxoglutarate aldolase